MTSAFRFRCINPDCGFRSAEPLGTCPKCKQAERHCGGMTLDCDPQAAGTVPPGAETLAAIAVIRFLQAYTWKNFAREFDDLWRCKNCRSWWWTGWCFEGSGHTAGERNRCGRFLPDRESDKGKLAERFWRLLESSSPVYVFDVDPDGLIRADLEEMPPPKKEAAQGRLL